MIYVRSLNSYYRNIQCLRDIDFSFEEDEKVVCIVGESGCGKSTFLNILAGISPNNCTFEFERFEMNGFIVDAKKREKLLKWNQGKIAFVSQQTVASFDPIRTVGDFLAVNSNGCDTIGKLQQLGILDAEEVLKKYPHECSIGMLQRICICGALQSNPEILFLDEATTGVDTINQYRLLSLIQSIIEKLSLKCLIATHDLRVACLIASHIYVMYGGMFIEHGTVEDILEAPKHEYTKLLVQAYNELRSFRKDESANVTYYNEISTDAKCSFYTNCTHPLEICLNKYPPIIQDGNHSFRCWHY